MARAADGTAIYAVGDVHGRSDLVVRATEAIETWTAEREQHTRTITVFLGDYIDRGPNSRAVLDHLIELKARAPFELTFLRGNHEQVLLDLIAGTEETTRWLSYGGRETLNSYGVDPPTRCSAEALREIASSAIPNRHIEFLTSTTHFRQLGDYVFVHAGLRPDRLIEEQSHADMLWRRMVTDQPPLWRETVVHGHSPSRNPVEGRYHIGIDTGAFESGALTVLRLENERRQFVQVGPQTLRSWPQVDTSYDLRWSDANAAPHAAAEERRTWWRRLFQLTEPS